MRPNRRRLLIAVLLLLAALLIAEMTAIDLWLQDRFYDFSSGRWVVDKNSPVRKFIFYQFPKIALILFGIYLIAVALGWRRCRCWTRRQAVFLLICLGGVPSLIGALKATTGVHCPSETTRYGGEHPYRRLIASIAAPKGERGHCFPAGHASGGFAVLGLYFAARSRGAARVGLGIGLAAGWAMGLYQMLKGAHFLSHTVVTMLVAWIVVEGVALMMLRQEIAPDAAR
jgi:membrane-associated PAP2 superfamily phosphatase